jgi:hypothetical protein
MSSSSSKSTTSSSTTSSNSSNTTQGAKSITQLASGKTVETRVVDGKTVDKDTGKVISRDQIVSTTVGGKTYKGNAVVATVQVRNSDGSKSTKDAYIVGNTAYDARTGAPIRSTYENQGYTVTWVPSDKTPGAPGDGSMIYAIKDTPSSGGGGGGGGGVTYIPVGPNAPTMPMLQQQKAVNRYEYIYGLKEISANSIDNEKNCIFVSTPVQVDGNIAQISLESKEVHPLLVSTDAGITNSRYTSVEYYISYVENPSLNDWMPILPENEEMVINELLFIKNKQAILRFPALITKDIKVYDNGTLIDNTDKFWEIGTPSNIIVFKKDYNPSHDYTINYYPNQIADPYLVDIVSSKKTATDYYNNHNEKGEVFDCANQYCTVTLSHTPYVDRSKINALISTDGNYNPNTSSYKPIQVYLENGTIVVPDNKTVALAKPYGEAQTGEVCTKNMTDYINNSIVELQPYSLTKVNGSPKNMVFEYKQEGDKLVFTENFQTSRDIENIAIAKADADIRVEYQYLVSHIRVKVILRRTGNTDYEAFTPIVKQYTLKIKTLE